MLVIPDSFHDSELLFDISITKGTMFTSESVTMITQLSRDIEAPSHSSTTEIMPRTDERAGLEPQHLARKIVRCVVVSAASAYRKPKAAREIAVSEYRYLARHIVCLWCNRRLPYVENLLVPVRDWDSVLVIS
jgi:hypothetical protein